MKKRKIAVLLLILLCASFLVQTNSIAQDAVSQAEVQFVPGEGPTVPVDPENPGTPGNGDGDEGEFLIISVTPLSFGSAEISAAEEKYNTETFRPNIQIVDLRGTAAGWKVSAKASRFLSGTDPSLPGASIQIINGRPNSLSAAAEPEQIENVNITTDETETPVIRAAEGTGMGHWVMRWYPQSDTGEYVKLRVPAGTATKGTHIARIDWILANTP